MNCELLYILWNPDNIAFHIGSFSFHWYSLCWLFGLLSAYLIVKRLYNEQKIKPELFDPLFVYCFIGILIGSRLGHCLFYEPDYFLSSGRHIVEMLLPIHFMEDGSWKFIGYKGLASHGGTIGLMIALWLYVRRTKVNIWRVLDNVAIATPTTACFIRLGNLMNSEIIGKATDVPWAFIFERVDMVPRHPGQLYEAIAYAVFFFIGWYLYRKHPDGHGLLLRTVHNAHLHRPLLHRVHKGHTGSVRGLDGAQHGPAAQHTVRHTGRGLHDLPQTDGTARCREVIMHGTA